MAGSVFLAQVVSADAPYYNFWHDHLAAFFTAGSLVAVVIILLLILILVELRRANRQRAQHHTLTKNPNGPFR